MSEPWKILQSLFTRAKEHAPLTTTVALEEGISSREEKKN